MRKSELKNLSQKQLLKECLRLHAENQDLKDLIDFGNPCGTTGANKWFDFQYCKNMKQVGFLQGFRAYQEWQQALLDELRAKMTPEEKRQAVNRRYEWLERLFFSSPER